MAFKLKSLPLLCSLHSPSRQNPNSTLSNHHFSRRFFAPSIPPTLCLSGAASASTFHRHRFFVTARSQDEDQITEALEQEEEKDNEEISRQGEKKELAKQGIWDQIKEIVMFTGPATGLWICGPLMSLIDTAVIGQRSSVELAALGPATVVCDYMCYVFMFLSIATSNMVATALAKQDKEEVQHHISVLLFVGLSCGIAMLLFTRLFGAAIITAFTGPKNVHVVPAASNYVKIRGLASPALLVGWVAQSASLGMKDSLGPLKALAAATVINVAGCVLLCTYLGYGIVGAAWATMVSQVVASYMMIQNLNMKGYNALAFSIPSGKELLTIFGLAAPVFITLMSKARMLLRSLVIIGAILGLLLGIIGTSVPWLFPNIFTPDRMVIQEMHKVLIPYFIALAVTPPTVSLEGTLLARFSMALQRLLSPKGILYSEDTEQYKLLKLRTA
ncbi:hypothetical protein JHK87_030590 [Glycine soja]|nr:hypothetical protein JHK87_030590 [Glycine soja]